MRVCGADGCDRKHEARGWCKMHYKRWRRWGLVEPPPRPTPEEAFWTHAVPSGGCWAWEGSRLPAGYGTFCAEGQARYAHRFAYELLVGPIPDGLTIDHLCRHPWCVNPAHLEAVTIRENILRSNNAAAINARKTHCPQGHPYDAENTIRQTKGGRVCRACQTARGAAA